MKKRSLTLILTGLAAGFCLFRIETSASRLQPNVAWARGAQYEVVSNGEKPVGDFKGLRFNKELEISAADFLPAMLLVDRAKNIYTYSGEQLLKYDPAGKGILRKTARSGQGPGEYQMPEFAMSEDGHIYVADPVQRRLTILDDRFQTIKIMKLGFYGGVIELGPKNNLHFLTLDPLPGTADRQKLTLSTYSTEGKLLWQGPSYQWGMTRDVRGIAHHAVYHPQIKYKVDREGNIYWAMTDRYEITQFDPLGAIRRTITRGGSTRKITDAEVQERTPKVKTPGLVFDLPERMPFIADLFVLENGWLAVVTFDHVEADSSVAADLFDEKGIYRAKILMPKYLNWDGLARPHKSLALFRDGCFYAIETDQSGEKYCIRRYRLDWQ